MEAVASLPTLVELCQHVHKKLCSHDRLDPRDTPLQRSLIHRSGKPCGLFFQVRGPRMLRTYAIWAGEENRILFYDSAGFRIGEIRLSEGPDPLNLVALA
jgi:hypothetical protein